MLYIRRSKAPRRAALVFALTLLLAALAAAQENAARPPVIFIPGLGGSELRHRETKKRVWFRLARDRRDDLRLPLTDDPAEARDALEPGDVLRRVEIGFAKIDVYGGFLEFLAANGYRETSWDEPRAENAVYLFAYDWRLDNAANARRLTAMIEDVKTRLGRPDLKFDVVAHSMGGLIARYAAMYGGAEPAAAEPRPDWPGAAHFRRVLLVGTPNAGSALSLRALVKGFTPFGFELNVPFVRNISRRDIFTIPSVYQLLPPAGALRAFDENLAPLALDPHDAGTWRRYGWNPLDDRKFARRLTPEEKRAAPRFFAAALESGRRFQAALAAAATTPAPAAPHFYFIGSECRATADGLLVRRRGAGFETLFRPQDFRRADGRRVTRAELKNLLLAPGDGIVSRRSLVRPETPAARPFLRCADHNFLLSNQAIRADLLKILKEN